MKKIVLLAAMLMPLWAFSQSLVLTLKTGEKQKFPIENIDNLSFDLEDEESGDMSPWEPFMADPALGRDGFGIYYFSEYYQGTDITLVESRHSLKDANQIEYRFQWYLVTEDPSLGMETFLRAASNDGGKTIYVPEQPYAFNQTYNEEVYVMEAGNYDHQASSGGSYFDETTGTFYLDVIYFIPELGYFGFGYEKCELNGFDRPEIPDDPNEDPDESWTTIGYVEYTDGYMCCLYLIDPLTYYVEVQESKEYEGFYRLVNPYGEAYPYNEAGDWNPNVDSYLYFSIYDPDCVYVDYSPQTLNWGDGELLCWSYAAYMMINGSDYSEVIAEGRNGTYKNGIVTFPFNTLLSSLGDENLYYSNFQIDIDATEASGKLVYVYGEDGQPVAPFKINMNTLTDNPPKTRAAINKDNKKVALEYGNTNAVSKGNASNKIKSMTLGRKMADRTGMNRSHHATLDRAKVKQTVLNPSLKLK